MGTRKLSVAVVSVGIVLQFIILCQASVSHNKLEDCEKDSDCPEGAHKVCSNNSLCELCDPGYLKEESAIKGSIKFSCNDEDECARKTNPCGEITFCINLPGGFLCHFDKPAGITTPRTTTTLRPPEDDVVGPKKETIVESAPLHTNDAAKIRIMMYLAISALLIIFIGKTIICLKNSKFSSKKQDIVDGTQQHILVHSA